MLVRHIVDFQCGYHMNHESRSVANAVLRYAPKTHQIFLVIRDSPPHVVPWFVLTANALDRVRRCPWAQLWGQASMVARFSVIKFPPSKKRYG